MSLVYLQERLRRAVETRDLLEKTFIPSKTGLVDRDLELDAKCCARDDLEQALREFVEWHAQ